MVSHLMVCLRSAVISDDEDAIESREDCCLQFYLICNAFAVLIASENWVGGCQNRATGIQSCGNTCLSDGYGLLFHSFVHDYSILWTHLIELVDATHTTTSQD